MHQNMQAVKMRFKPLRNSSHDTDIIFELASRLKVIVGGNKGVYAPIPYPTTNKEAHKTPCNMIVYIRMYTTIASRLKGYRIHYKEARGKHSENVQKSHCLKSAAVTICRYQKEDQTSGNLIEDQFRLSESFGGSHLEAPEKPYISPFCPFCQKINPSVFRNISIHYCNVYLLDVYLSYKISKGGVSYVKQCKAIHITSVTLSE